MGSHVARSHSVTPSGDGPQPPSTAHHVARWISIVGHPFVLIVAYALAGAAAVLPLRDALTVAAVVLVGAIVPLLVYLGREVRSGGGNFDVSARERRAPIYGFALILGVGLLGYFYGSGAPKQLLVGLGFGLLLVVVAALINLRLKVSVHSAFAAFVGIGFLPLSRWAAAVLIAFACLVGGSRLVLRRHRPAEVLSGLLLGGAVASIMLAVAG